jgi:hypothetical protein
MPSLRALSSGQPLYRPMRLGALDTLVTALPDQLALELARRVQRDSTKKPGARGAAGRGALLSFGEQRGGGRGQNAAACGRFQFRAQISNWSSSHAAARARPVAYGNVKKRQTAWGRRPGKLLLRRFVVQRTATTPTPSTAGYSPAPVSELAMPCQR